MKLGLLIAAAAAVVALSSASTASAKNFFFSFDNDPTLGNVDGTVTGEIFGLSGPGFIHFASDVEILSYPSGLTGLPKAPFSIDAYAKSLGEPISKSIFHTSHGQITFGNFQIFGGWFDLNVDGVYNELVSPDGSTFVQNMGGFAAAHFAAPEPSTWAMLLLGMGGLGAALRTRRLKSHAA